MFVPTSSADNTDYFGSGFEDDDGDLVLLLAPKIDELFVPDSKDDSTYDFAINDEVNSHNK